jgi:uncharacterized protein (TIGR02145 family)
MRKMLLSVCVALAVLGCGGDDGDLPESLDWWKISVYGSCGGQAFDYSTDACSEGTVYPKCYLNYNPDNKCEGQIYSSCRGGVCMYCDRDRGLFYMMYDPSTEFCSDSTIYLKVYSKCGGMDYNPSTQYCSNGNLKTYYGFLTDSRDGKAYKITVIGSQTWFAQDLNYNALGSKCYNNSDSNCDTYGRLYDWSTAMGLNASYNNSSWDGNDAMHRGICPEGWHIPSDDDWDILMDYADSSVAGTKLKAASGWRNYNDGDNGNGTDDYGFTALSGGNFSESSFNGVGTLNHWWSATERDASTAYYQDLHNSYSDVRKANESKSSLYSVRCVQDGEEKSSSSVPSSSSLEPSSSSLELSSSSSVPGSSSLALSSSSSVPSSSSLALSSSSLAPSSSSYVHIGKGNNISNYRTVVIGTQTWMAENLDYVVEGGVCYNSYCGTYGLRYDWSTAMALPSSCNPNFCWNQVQYPHRGICPSGWHIPSVSEWNIMTAYIGGASTEGKKLKATSFGGTDDYGFSALMYYGSESWWSAGVSTYESLVQVRTMTSNGDSAVWDYYNKISNNPVRCVQDYGSKGNNINNYKTVIIGTQTWMAENLDYAVEGSRCYANCATYGRLYDWPTAMALPSSCNPITCSSQIQQPHRGICPDGWHIPSSEDWGKLFGYVDGTSGGSAEYTSPTAGKYLKATSGWNGSNGTDEYGFSALPGGHAAQNLSFYEIGRDGYWWSRSGGSFSTNAPIMQHISYGDGATLGLAMNGSTFNLLSVRCLKD